MSGSTKAKLLDIIIDEIKNVPALLVDGTRSGGWLYPFKGIIYLYRNKPLWRLIIPKIGPTAILCISVTTGIFFFTYLPQAAVLSLTHGPMAPISTILLVLSESAMVSNFIAQKLLLGGTLTDIFDSTLLAAGHGSLVAQGRHLQYGVDIDQSADPMAALGKRKLFLTGGRPAEPLSVTTLVRAAMWWPLNFVPVVGTLLYVAVQGRRIGPRYHKRYFQLKGWNNKERLAWVSAHRATYSSFGAAAFSLEMIPFAALAFAFTNTTGAALWASSIEKKDISEGKKVCPQ